MSNTKKIEIALLIIRVTTAIFLGLWATLKFWRPEWQRNIFSGSYNIGFIEITDVISYGLGALQLVVVFAFLIGLWRFWTYGLMMLMSAAGVLGSLDSFLVYYNFPKNLMLTSIPTLGALVALFILRDMDNLFSISGRNAENEAGK
ncbi:MAG: DoxX protein [Pseudomonadota bacterium]